MADLFTVDEGFERVLICPDLLKDQLCLKEIIDGILILVTLHIKRRVHLCFIAFNLDEGEVVDSAICLLEELFSRDTSPVKALERVHTDSVRVCARRHCTTSSRCLATRKSGGMLLHLHGEGPV